MRFMVMSLFDPTSLPGRNDLDLSHRAMTLCDNGCHYTTTEVLKFGSHSDYHKGHHSGWSPDLFGFYEYNGTKYSGEYFEGRMWRRQRIDTVASSNSQNRDYYYCYDLNTRRNNGEYGQYPPHTWDSNPWQSWNDGHVCFPEYDCGEVRKDLSMRTCFCLLYTSPSPRDKRLSRMPSSA